MALDLTTMARRVGRAILRRGDWGGAGLERSIIDIPGDKYGRLRTPHGDARVARRHAMLPGSEGYPPPPQGPAIPDAKAPRPRNQWRYYPQWHVTEHPRRWEFPAYLDNPS